jgi:hypothetical protein
MLEKERAKNKQGETQVSKVSCSPGGQPVSATNPENWMSYEDAEKSRMKPSVDGIGYCFSPEDTVTGIDLDDCRDSSTGEIDDWALEVMNNISTFWEISPSGTGFHGYAHAILPGPKNKANVADAEGHIEMYEENRFFTCTGNELTQVSTGSVDYQQVLDYRQTEIENGWDDAVETAYTVISQNGITGLSDIEVTGLAMISFGCAVHRDMATDMDADDPIETEEVESAMLYIARSMGDTRESHVDEFLRLLSVSDPAQETYRMDDNDKLRVNVTKAHHSVCQYLKDHDLTDSYDILNRPRDYSRRMEDKMQSESYIIDKKNDHIVNRCYTIDIDEANNTIDGLEISNFL